MGNIQVLDKEVVDLIAAGEVVERPFNVVKELCENAIDAGSDALTVEIREGGLKFIRVTDNGCGISKEDVRTAFLPHATSKIREVADLGAIRSLGFRGEALSSISAVSNCEVITKTEDALTGVRYMSEGGEEILFEEIGAPKGTTFVVRELFYNVPARRKFLKSAQSEASHIGDLMEHLALSRPEISIRFISNGKPVFSTSGNGNLKEVIYRIYGKEVSDRLMEVEGKNEFLTLSGYIGKPEINRGNRSGENFFLNGRYVNCEVLQKAVEEGYRGYMMLHKFPFTVLHVTMDPRMTDVNVHPAKLTAKLLNPETVYAFVSEYIGELLSSRERIPDVILSPYEEEKPSSRSPEPFENNRIELDRKEEEQAERKGAYKAYAEWVRDLPVRSEEEEEGKLLRTPVTRSAVIKKEDPEIIEEAVQLKLFDEQFLTEEAKEHYEVLGQIFLTYWLIAYSDKLFLMDQHAAHEKVKYERLLKAYHEKTVSTQMLNPPLVVDLNAKEYGTVKDCGEIFSSLGFEIEDFGLSSVALRGVPTDLYGCDEMQLFREILDELVEDPLKGDPDVCLQKLASMACKAAVKGNRPMTVAEVSALLDELLTLDNPYNCPHGRPTIISMSKYELDRKFKRIVT